MWWIKMVLSWRLCESAIVWMFIDVLMSCDEAFNCVALWEVMSPVMQPTSFSPWNLITGEFWLKNQRNWRNRLMWLDLSGFYGYVWYVSPFVLGLGWLPTHVWLKELVSNKYSKSPAAFGSETLTSYVSFHGVCRSKSVAFIMSPSAAVNVRQQLHQIFPTRCHWL